MKNCGTAFTQLWEIMKKCGIVTANKLGYTVCELHRISFVVVNTFRRGFYVDVNQLMEQLQEQWVLGVVALVIIFIVMRIVKTFVKWILMIAILLGLILYVYPDSEIAKETRATIVEPGIKLLESKTGKFEYEKKADGTFVVVKNGVQIQGKPGDEEVKLTYLGQTISIPFDQTLKMVLEAAEKEKQANKK
jgi:GTP:adenosylcobinamide-phosphate guanylyltransferase